MTPGISAVHKFKLAAIEKTIAYPVEPSFYLGDLRLILGLLLLSITGLVDRLLALRRTKNIAT